MVFCYSSLGLANVRMENLLTKYYGHWHRAMAVGIREIEIQDLVGVKTLELKEGCYLLEPRVSVVGVF